MTREWNSSPICSVALLAGEHAGEFVERRPCLACRVAIETLGEASDEFGKAIVGLSQIAGPWGEMREMGRCSKPQVEIVHGACALICPAQMGFRNCDVAVSEFELD